MEKIPFSKFKRNPELIKKQLKSTDMYITTKSKMYVLFPERYAVANLAIIDNTVKVMGILMISDTNNNYSVMLIPNYITFTPDKIEDVEIQGKVYVRLEFEKGSIMVNNINIVESEAILFNIFDEFIIKGNTPIFLTYKDLTDLYSKAGKYCGSKINADPTAVEILVSVVCRSSNDLGTLYRNTLKTPKDLAKRPKFIKLLDVYSFPDTLSKIGGSYFKKGLDSAIVNPSSDTTALERVVRE